MTDFEVQESAVIYSTKEIVERIDKRLDHLESISESAFTRIEGSALAARVGILETDASGTKAVAKALLASGKDRFSRNEKIVGLVFGVVALVPSITSIVNLFSH